jgi:predicted O-methyltransferase YrrM
VGRPFDMVFIDADKPNNPNYRVMGMVAPGTAHLATDQGWRG